MPTYSYRCTEHGDFQRVQRMKDHASAECPDCGTPCKQVILTAPSLDETAMANIGMPGAWEKQGDRIEKRHRAAGQHHRAAE